MFSDGCDMGAPLARRRLAVCLLVLGFWCINAFAGTDSWNVSSDGLWTTASNWSTGALPGASDDVVIDRPGGTYSITLNSGTQSVHSVFSNEQFTLTGATLDIASASQFNQAFTLASATLTGAGDLTLGGTFSWTGGAMQGTGRTQVASGANGTIGNSETLERNLQNDGNVTFSGQLNLKNATWTNNGSAMALGGTWLYTGAGTSVFNNNGTITTAAGAGSQASFELVFNNIGTVNVSSGTMQLWAGGNHSGSFNIASGATLALMNGAHAFTSSAAFTGLGTVYVQGGTASFAGPLNLPTMSLTIGGGTTSLDSASSVSKLSLASGTITGAGDLTVGNTLTWATGTMQGAGKVIIGSGATGTISGATLSRNLQNDGSLTLSGQLTPTNAAFVNNGTTTVLGGTWFHTGSGTNVFNNNGTFINAAGTGSQASFEVPFNNAGTVNINSGALQLWAGGSHSGSFNITSGATLFLANGTHSFGSAATFGGGGTVLVQDGTSNFAGSLNLTGMGLTLTGGTTNLNGPSTVSNLNLASGTIAGAGNLTVSGNLNWSSGTLQGAGTMTLAAGSTATIGNGALTLSRDFINNGAITWTGYRISLGNSTFTNNGVFTASSGGGQLQTQVGVNSFKNNGTFNANASVSADFPFNNAGTLNVNTNSMVLNGGSYSGAVNIASGATLQLNGGTNAFSSTATFGGGGTLLLQGGAMSFAGPLNLSGVALTVTGGTVTLDASSTVSNLSLASGTMTGAGNVTISQNLLWTTGTLQGIGRTIVGSGATGTIGAIGASGTNVTLSRDIQNDGGLTLYGQITPTNAAFVNNGTATALSTTWYHTGSGTNVFNNNGTFISAAGAGSQASFEVPFNNAGSVNVSSGSLQLWTGGNQTGSFNVASGATLMLAGGANAFGPSVTFSGAGTLLIQGGTESFAGPLNLAAVGLKITQGTTSLDVPSLVSKLELATGTITGAGNLTVGGSFNWTTGTMQGPGKTIMGSGATGTIGALGASGSNVTLSRNLQNDGNLTLCGQITPNNAAFVNNGTATALSNTWYHTGTGTNAFNNSGTFISTAGAGSQASFEVPFNNAGNVNVTSGSLQLWAGGSHSGAFNVASGASLMLTGGAHTFSPSATFGGAGTLLLQGGSATFGGPLNLAGVDLTIIGGIAAVNVPSTVSNVNLATGTLNGAGDLNIGGILSWSTGTMQGTGKTILASSAVGIISGGTLDGRTMENFGSMVLLGSLTLSQPTSLLHNNAVATISVQPGVTSLSGIGTLKNDGTFRVPGALFGVAGTRFDNAGITSIDGGGSLTLAAGGSASGSFNIQGGDSLLSFSGGTYDFTSGASVVGDGTLAFAGAAVRVAGTAQVQSPIAMSAGTLAILNGGRLDTSLVSVTGGGVTLQPGGILAAAGLRLGATSITASADATLPGKLVLNGDVAVIGANKSAILASTTPSAGQGAGVLDLGGDQRTLYVLDGSSSLSISARITNGTLIKDGGGSLALSGPLGFAGGLKVLGGTVTITTPAAANAFTGGVTIASSGLYASTLSVGADDQFGDLSNGITLSGATLAATSSFSTNRALNLAGVGGDGTIDVSTGSTMSIGSSISGPGGLFKRGTGTLLLSAANHYTGQTAISQGTLKFAGAGSLDPASVVAIAGGTTLDTGGTAQSLGALKGAGNVVIWAGPFTIGANGAVTNFGGVISGTGSVTKTGPGETTFAGNNTFTGGLTVNQGRMVLSSANSFSGGVTSSGLGTLSVSNDAALGVGGNAVTLVNGGTLEAAGSFATARAVTVSGSGIVAVTAGNVLTASAPFKGAGDLTKSGMGGARSTAVDSLSGQLNVGTDGGTFSLTVSGTALNVKSERVNNGGILELSNNQGGNLADRLPDAAPVFLDGGTLQLVGIDGGASAETLGQLIAEAGKSTVAVAPGSGGASTATLSFAGGLGPRVAGATLNVTGTGLGTSARVLLSGQAAGRLPTWIKANGLFATYDLVYGVVPTTFTPPPAPSPAGETLGDGIATNLVVDMTVATTGNDLMSGQNVPEPGVWPYFALAASFLRRHRRGEAQP